MIIGYLKYKRGFSISEFMQLFNSKTISQLSIEQIYLPILDINLNDVVEFSGELSGVPLRINKEIEKGFTLEMIQWLKTNVLFSDFAFEQGYLTNKLIADGIELWLFEKDNQILGRSSEEHQDSQMLKIEVSIDNMNPEFYGYILEKLFAAGANDVYIEQVIMKKNRPGQVLHILCQNEKRDELISLIFAETTTLGIRYAPYTVHRLKREFVQIETEWGTVNLKLGYFQGNMVQLAPEYEECVEIAKKYNIPLKLVYDTVRIKGLNLLNG